MDTEGSRGVGLALASVVVMVLLVGGCTTQATRSGGAPPTSAPVAGTSTTSTPGEPAESSTTTSTAAPTTTTSAAGGPVVADGHGWTGAGLEGTMPPPGSCTYRMAADGYQLPDPSCTPGSIDPTVTQANLSQTICRSGGYTDSVRPPESLTEPAKYSLMDAYGSNESASHYELDHLVPLEVGGASSIANLWPELDVGSPAQFDPSDPYGQNAKDGVENALHDAVCDGKVSLSAAQDAIVTDWTTALTRLGISQ
ncbi:MAG TPA: hypothetical protein VMR97_05175 [Acidimicrobiales bacterium]|nr:hypothetical protein [Acidimicrobiales bacterium]